MEENRIILVDFFDREIGAAEKLEAHEKGLLHRAFSVFIFSGERLLMQKRAAGKYHSAGLWANTCCSHPRVGETLCDAAKRRLFEEAGIELQPEEAGSFVYRAVFENGLTEFELDHVFTAEYDGDFKPDPDEAAEMCWKNIADIAEDMRAHPENYAPWFITAFLIAVKSRNN